MFEALEFDEIIAYTLWNWRSI